MWKFQPWTTPKCAERKAFVGFFDTCNVGKPSYQKQQSRFR